MGKPKVDYAELSPAPSLPDITGVYQQWSLDNDQKVVLPQRLSGLSTAVTITTASGSMGRRGSKGWDYRGAGQVVYWRFMWTKAGWDL